MRIVIDMQGAQTESRLRGIGRYTLSLVKSLVRNRGDHEIILALSGLLPDTIIPIRTEFDGLVPQNNICVWEAPGPTSEWNPDNTWRRKAAELIREAFLKNINPDFVLLTSLFEGYGENFAASIKALDKSTPIAVIFYDLIPLIYRDTYLTDPYTRNWYNNKVEQLKQADLLLSISDASRQEAIDVIGFPKKRIVNISTAADQQFRPLAISSDQTAIGHRLGLVKPFLMYSSATDWRKNHLRLIDAYSKLPAKTRANHQLAFVGVRKHQDKLDFEKFAKKCGLAKGELVIIGYVPDNEINLLYNLCKLFVFPSWHEGFGLPALEAMQCGRAVIGSNRSSIPEVIGRADALFDPYDAQSIAKKIEEVLDNDTFRAELERYSLVQSKKFSWDTTAIKAIGAMESHISSTTPILRVARPRNEPDDLIATLVEKIGGLAYHHTDGDLRSTANAICQNFTKTSHRQLLVNISEFVEHDAKSGIQRVVRCILREWLSNQPEGFQVEAVYASKNQPYRYARRFVRDLYDRPDINQQDEVIEFRSGDYFLGLDLVNPEIITSHQEFYQHLRRHNVVVKFVVYDLLPIHLPQHANHGVQTGHKKWLDVVTQSDGAICISKSVSSELSEYLSHSKQGDLNRFHIDWIHLGADIECSTHFGSPPGDADHLISEFVRRPTFLSVGTIEPRKGQAQTLAAFEELWHQGYDINLVFVGKQGWLVDALTSKLRSHPEFNERLFWLEGISDEYLENIYAASTCLVAASYGEGFGLPLIEAAQHKLPIIARDIPVFREVAGAHAFYFSGESPGDLARAILDWLPRHACGHAPKSENMPWLTWKQSADQLMQCIKDGMKSCN